MYMYLTLNQSTVKFNENIIHAVYSIIGDMDLCEKCYDQGTRWYEQITVYAVAYVLHFIQIFYTLFTIYTAYYTIQHFVKYNFMVSSFLCIAGLGLFSLTLPSSFEITVVVLL